MRRLVAAGLGVSLALAVTGGAVAAPNDNNCAADPAGWTAYHVDQTWEFGDPIPGAGEDPWWDMTLTGFTAEGLSPAAAAALFGVASVDELYELIVVNLRGLDRNGNAMICGKPIAENGWTHGVALPAYIFNAIDDNAKAR